MAQKKKKIGLKSFFILLVTLIVSIIFWSSSLLIIVGMLPSLVLWVIDKTIDKSKTLTIAAMNFVGCYPYLIEVWNSTYPAEQSVKLLTDPLTIIMIYCMALLGYIINYITAMVVASHVYEKTEKRIQAIDKEIIELEKRWGKKVNGDIPLDPKGFPLEGHDPIAAEES